MSGTGSLDTKSRDLVPDTAYLKTQEMQHSHGIQNFLDHGIRNTDFLKLAVKAAAGFKEPFIC